MGGDGQVQKQAPQNMLDSLFNAPKQLLGWFSEPKKLQATPKVITRGNSNSLHTNKTNITGFGGKIEENIQFNHTESSTRNDVLVGAAVTLTAVAVAGYGVYKIIGGDADNQGRTASITDATEVVRTEETEETEETDVVERTVETTLTATTTATEKTVRIVSQDRVTTTRKAVATGRHVVPHAGRTRRAGASAEDGATEADADAAARRELVRRTLARLD